MIEEKPKKEQTLREKENLSDKRVNALSPDMVKSVSDKLLIRPDAEGNYSIDKIKREHPDDINAAIDEVELEKPYDDSIPFSLVSGNKPTRAASLGKNAVEVISRRLFSRLGLHQGGKISMVVHDTESTLPKPIQEQIKRDNAQGKVRGVYYDGSFHIVASNVFSEQEIPEFRKWFGDWEAAAIANAF